MANKTNPIKLFFAWVGAWINRKKLAKARAEKEAKTKASLDKKFLTDTKTLAQEMTNMHAAFKKQYPTNYVKKMQPYFIMLDEYMKTYKVDPIGAALMLVKTKTRNRDIIGIYATSAEMFLNIKKDQKPNNGATSN